MHVVLLHERPALTLKAADAAEGLTAQGDFAAGTHLRCGGHTNGAQGVVVAAAVLLQTQAELACVHAIRLPFT